MNDIKERMRKAAPGPWHRDAGLVYNADGYVIAQFNDGGDCEFSIHARTDIPKLIKKVEELDQLLKRVQDAYNEGPDALKGVLVDIQG